MAILVYGDDSADEKAERVVAVTGVVGTIQAWRSVERQWIAMTNGIPFHAHDCDSDHGDYEKFTHTENKQLYRDLVTLLAESHLWGYGLAIDMAASERVFPGMEDLAYYRAFVEVLQWMKNIAKKNDEVAECTFDMRMESEHNAGLLYGIARESEPEWTSRLSDKIEFAFSRKTPRLQVADLVAREVMKALDNYIGPKKRPIRKSWKALRDTGRFHGDAFSDDWFNGLKKDYPQLQAAVGFNQNDYIQWLAERKRHHNMTNLFLFLRAMTERDAKVDRNAHLERIQEL